MPPGTSQEDAGPGFDFDVTQRGFLRFGKGANLFLGKSDVVDVGRVQCIDTGRDFSVAQAVCGGGPAVELLRKLPYGLIAALLDGSEYVFDRLAYADPVFLFLLPGYTGL